MGATKTSAFTPKQNVLASLAKGLAHPARIAILEYLAGRNSCVCGDIVDELPLSQSTVSQHLKALKETGLIQGEIEGTKVCYCIDPIAWKNAKSMLTQLFDAYSEAGECC